MGTTAKYITILLLISRSTNTISEKTKTQNLTGSDYSVSSHSHPHYPARLLISWLVQFFPSISVTVFGDEKIEGFGQHFLEETQNQMGIAAAAGPQFSMLQFNYSNLIRFISSSRTTVEIPLLTRLSAASPESSYANSNSLYFVICLVKLGQLDEMTFLLAQTKKWSLKPYYIIFIEDSTVNANNTKSMNQMVTKALGKYLLLTTNLYIFQKMFATRDTYKSNQIETRMEFLELYAIKKIPIFQLKTFTKLELYNILSAAAAGRKNFRKIPVRGVAEIFLGLEWSARIEVENSTGNVNFKDGYNVHEFLYLRDALNFTVVYVKGTGLTRAYVNGTVEGMGLQIERHEADISITPSEMTALRFEHIQFLHSTLLEDLYLYFRQLPANYVRNMYIEAFSPSVWFGILTSICLFTLSIIIISSVERVLNMSHPTDNSYYHDSWLWSFSTFCQQGWHFSPEAIPLKIIMICGLLAGLIIYTAFSASLVSLLSTSVAPVKSLDEAVEHGMTIYYENHTISARYIFTTKQAEGRIKQDSPNGSLNYYEIDAVQGYEKISKSTSAFITPHLMFLPQLLMSDRSLSLNDLCTSLTFVLMTERPQQSTMFVAKNSEFKEHFNIIILQMLERGIRDHLFQKFIVQKSPKCMDKTKNHQLQRDPIDVGEIRPAIVFISLAYVGCLLILGGEILVTRTQFLSKKSLK